MCVFSIWRKQRNSIFLWKIFFRLSGLNSFVLLFRSAERTHCIYGKINICFLNTVAMKKCWKEGVQDNRNKGRHQKETKAGTRTTDDKNRERDKNRNGDKNKRDAETKTPRKTYNRHWRKQERTELVIESGTSFIYFVRPSMPCFIYILFQERPLYIRLLTQTTSNSK